MNLLSLDLEMNQPTGEIIQVGACVYDAETGLVVDRLSRYVFTPHPISPFISTLTGITDEHLEELGVSLLEAYRDLADMHAKHQCFRNALTWGGGDSQCLQEQLALRHKGQYEWLLGRRWIDAKTVYQAYCLANDVKIQSGLKKSCGKLGLTFQGPAHNALQDAINTAYIYGELLERFKQKG